MRAKVNVRYQPKARGQWSICVYLEHMPDWGFLTMVAAKPTRKQVKGAIKWAKVASLEHNT